MPDLRELPLERMCNFVYWRLVDGADQQGIDKLRQKLWMPPKGIVPDARSPWSQENESKGFASLAAQVGKKTGEKKPPRV